VLYREVIDSYAEKVTNQLRSWSKENKDFRIGYIQGFADALIANGLVSDDDWEYFIRIAVAKL
jgi:hypothetical protein